MFQLPKNPGESYKTKMELKKRAFRHETYMIFIFGRKIDGGIFDTIKPLVVRVSLDGNIGKKPVRDLVG